MASQEFQFVPPPEAPVFRPTWEEFQDALQYINKIRPVAEQYGICKIIPPPDWQPPFAVDVDNFKFTPRIQRLNELEAHTRIKLNFLDQIAKFWELQGSSLKIPVIDKKALDLYSLHKKVQDAGGADLVTRNRGWTRIASALGFPNQKNVSTQLKHLYDKILQPFDIFNKSKEVPQGREKECSDDDPDYVAEPRDYKPHEIPSRMAGKIPENEKNGRRSRRYQNNTTEDDDNCSDSKELKKLQFKGPGPKNTDVDKDTKTKGRNRKAIFYEHDPLAKYICLNCGRGDAEEHMLLCDGCDDSYHTFCLVPTLTEVPKGDWRCPKCVAVEVSKPLEAFGFEQAQKVYNLQSFGQMADKFKQDYFNMPVHLVPQEMAEREFWRIVSSIDEDVTVEYGADLHTMDHGSGFPTNNSKQLMTSDKEYANDSWNLNNLPIQEGSVLAHIGCDISGMKVPWMYVGMCFSTFCWHNEDHWSYSINYLHWGEPKTWYGVPGGEAEKFENCMKQAAPELFQSQPDLLHQLVTIMNPNILMKGEVPIVRCDQHAGEFMITFPRSYHAGFNQGYNFAEAVNFAPPDWLSIGRECIQHYSNLKRYCVFSHDELVSKMAASPHSLDLTVAAATYQDMLKMVDSEKKLRKALLYAGVTNAEREAFELLPDDERQCDYCKTTCFLSAVTCPCSPAKLVCLQHYTNLCNCAASSYTLRYRYTLDELPPMLQKLKERAESFDNWASKVKQAFEAKELEDKLELEDLRELVTTAEERRFPDSELLGALLAAVAEADKCAAVAAHLAAKKVRTRTRGCSDPKSRLTLEELQLFYDQINSLACTIKEADGVKQLLDTVMDFQRQANKSLVDGDKWLSEYQIRPDDEEEEDDNDNKDKIKENGVEKMEVEGDAENNKKETASNRKITKKPKKKRPAVNAVVNDATKKEPEEGINKETKEEEEDSKMDAKESNIKSESEEDDEDDDDALVQSEEISKLLETGLNLDIDLPELPKLRHRLQKVEWLEEVQDILDPPSTVSVDAVKQLLAKSQSLPPHRCIETTRMQLQVLLVDIDTWDAKAAALLQSKQCSVMEAEELLKDAEKVPAHLPAVSSLRDAVKKAREWQAKAAAVCRNVQSTDSSPSATNKNSPANNTASKATTDTSSCANNKNSAGNNNTDNNSTNNNISSKDANGLYPNNNNSSNHVSHNGTNDDAVATTNGSASPNSGPPSKQQNTPLLEAVESLLHRARPIPLKLPELQKLEAEVASAQAWLEKTARTFLKKNSPYSLVEVLMPRTEIGLVSCPKRKRVKKDDMTTLQQTASLLDITTQHATNSTILVAAYKECEEREIKAVRAIRSHNQSKRYNYEPKNNSKNSPGGGCDNDPDSKNKNTSSDGNSSSSDSDAGCVSPSPVSPEAMQTTFCVCHKAAAPDMLQCCVCLDRFHAGCVPSSSNRTVNIDGSTGTGSLSISRYICPSCQRSRRPRLDTILALLVALQKIHVRLCEAGALQCLTERAMAWQDRAQHLLLTQDLVDGLETLQHACALIVKHQAINEDSLSSSERLWNTNLGLSGSSCTGGSAEHGYSNKQSPSNKDSSGFLQSLTTQKVTSLLSTICSGPDKPLVTIAAATRRKMRDLLLEGELLEVTMEETVQLFRLLEVSENPVSKISDILVSLGNQGSHGDEKVKKNVAKKRKSPGGAGPAGGGSTDGGNAAKSAKNMKSPKRPKLSNLYNNINNTTNNKTSADDTNNPKKIIKKKSSSTSKLTEGKRKDNITAGSNASQQQPAKKKRPLAISQSSSSIGSSNTATGSTTNTSNTSNKTCPTPTQPKSPKKAGPKSSTATSAKHPKKRAARSSTVNNHSSAGGSGSSSDDDEMCAAAKCKIPVGSAVDWVQCDVCNGWFHYVCVGLKATDLREDEDYICTLCCSGNKSSSKPSSTATKS